MGIGAELRVGTLNIASGRGPDGGSATAGQLAEATAGLNLDVLAVQEVDADQPRSHDVDQAAVLARALDAADWRAVATVHGTPDAERSWTPADPPQLRGPDGGVSGGPGREVGGPQYGIALLTRRPVRRWSVLGLGTGRARLPILAPDPRTGRSRWCWVRDEPRVAIAAELDALTVVGTHLSFAPGTALRQLLRLRHWAAALPGPVLVAGDLNLPGSLPARVLGGERLVCRPSYPTHAPRLQLDHLIAVGGGLTWRDPVSQTLGIGDHRLVSVLLVSPSVVEQGPKPRQ